MTLTVEAVYVGGVFKPHQPLPLKEHTKVRICVEELSETVAAPNEAEHVVRRSHGLLGWTGDVEALRRLAMDPEFDPQESA